MLKSRWNFSTRLSGDHELNDSIKWITLNLSRKLWIVKSILGFRTRQFGHENIAFRANMNYGFALMCHCIQGNIARSWLFRAMQIKSSIFGLGQLPIRISIQVHITGLYKNEPWTCSGSRGNKFWTAIMSSNKLENMQYDSHMTDALFSSPRYWLGLQLSTWKLNSIN